ncbi:hypothetical protein SUGI_0423740 [Cryptomeria japonica]|nr:hypothetical protein SUGI_0423740 [Cryptomeria japonica]
MNSEKKEEKEKHVLKMAGDGSISWLEDDPKLMEMEEDNFESFRKRSGNCSAKKLGRSIGYEFSGRKRFSGLVL